MPGRVLKRKVTTVATGRVKRSMPPAQNLAGSDPDLLRNTIFNALKALPPDEHSRLRDKILSDLETAPARKRFDRRRCAGALPGRGRAST